MQLLPPEDDAELSDGERRLRGFLGLAYRFMAAIFTASHIFDFLFNSVWMHGYIWFVFFFSLERVEVFEPKSGDRFE